MDSKTSNDYIVSSLGYLLVALLSAFSGYSLSLFICNCSINNIQDNINIGILIAFTLLLLPYLFSREVLLERENIPDLNNHEMKTNSRNIPLYFLITFISLDILLSYIIYLKEFIDESNLKSLMIMFVLGLMPFLFLYCRSNYLLKRKKSHINITYSFLESILLPALHVVIIPFSIGWAIVGSTINLEIVLVAVIFLFILSVITFRFKGISSPKNFIILFASTTVLLICILFIDPLYFKFMLTSIVLTLVLGVSEVTKRVYLLSIHNNHNRYTPELNNILEDYKFYLGSGKLVGVSLPFLLPSIALLWDILSIKVFFFIASLQIIHWFIIIKKSDINHLDFWIALFLGILLQLLIIIQYYFDFSISYFSIKIDSASSFIVELFSAFITAISFFFYSKTNSDIIKYYNIFIFFLLTFIGLLFSYTFLQVISGDSLLKLLVFSGYLLGIISLIVHWNKIKILFKSIKDDSES